MGNLRLKTVRSTRIYVSYGRRLYTSGSMLAMV
jgi:hypothetical protein